MANKKISDLDLRTNFDATCQLPVDDATQTYRVTGAQLQAFLLQYTNKGDIPIAGVAGVPSVITAAIVAGLSMLTQVGTGAASDSASFRSLADIFQPTRVTQYTANASGTHYLTYIFHLPAASSASPGATYTHNGFTFTVKDSLAAGKILYASGTGAPLYAGVLTKSAGTGDSTITFAASMAPKMLKVRAVGGGGGGSGSGSASAGSGGTGGNTTFGTGTANGGSGNSGPAGGAGGGATLPTGATGHVVPGGSGQGASNAVQVAGGQGGSGMFGGGGGGGNAAASPGAGGAGAVNSGGGGGGAGGGPTNIFPGAGGGAGGGFEAIIQNPAVSYAWAIGVFGSPGSAGTSGAASGAGALGRIIVEESCYA